MVDVGGGLGYLEGDEVGDGYGRDEEEEEEGLGGAKGHEKLERHAERYGFDVRVLWHSVRRELELGYLTGRNGDG